MMYGMSPLRRALYFLLPLVFGLILTGIVVIDAANTPHPDTTRVAVELPEGHNWVLFDLTDPAASGRAIAGTTIAVEAGRNVLSGEVPAGRTQLLFDLGEASTVDSVEIAWPDGRVQRYGSVPINARYKISYPATATASLRQWFEMNGPFYRLAGFIIAGILLVLFAVRVVVWAETRTGSHGEAFMH